MTSALFAQARQYDLCERSPPPLCPVERPVPAPPICRYHPRHRWGILKLRRFYRMSTELAAFSAELAAIVEKSAASVVAVHARPRFSSSGVFWRPGVIVTAEHTIRREDEITVTLPNGTNAPAILAGSDPGTDLAVLKAEFPAPLLKPAAGPIAGQIALTIGRSQDSGVNATLGIISAVSGDWRTWRGGRLDQYIRLDLTLYPGSSGGAVVNVAGETLGIATSALSRIAGVAIPSATINRVVDQILARGRVSR